MQSPEDGRGDRTGLASIGGIERKLFHVKHRGPSTARLPRSLDQKRASSSTIAAAFSAIIKVGALVLPEVMVGITDASAIRSPATP